MKEQLQLKEIVGYLPYGLKAEILDYKCDYVGRQYDEIIGLKEWSKEGDWCLLTDGCSKPSLDRVKPILVPISSLTEFLREIYQEYNYSLLAIKEMPYGTIVTYQLMGETFKDIVYSQGSFNCCPMFVFNKLLEKKLDVYNLIEKGLAIEVTEEFNPYK
jgi:hypothetical protein